MRNPLSAWCVAALLCTFQLTGQESRLANLATRAQTQSGAAILTAGFVIGAGGDKQVVIRAVGPTLANFGLSGVLADPILTLVNGAGATVASNDDWAAANAALMTSVGAFALPVGSKDSVIVTTLPPGSYTAQVSGAGGGEGLTIVEVYEVGSTGGKLVNISTRGVVGTGANVMIPGIVVSPGTGARKLVIRAAGPALTAFGLSGALLDPALVVTNAGGTQIAANNDWGTPIGSNPATPAQLAAAFTQAGAFNLAVGSRDSAVLVDLSAGNYSVEVSGVGGASGLALVEIYDITPSANANVTLAATIASADKSGSKPGEFTFTRAGDLSQALTVNYVTGGTAVNGFDYPFLPGTITIPGGSASATVRLAPNPSVLTTGGQTATLTIATGSGNYSVGSPASATVTIADSPATLYVASLRPDANVSGSSASGSATILVNKDGTLANVTMTFSGLSSAQTAARLRIGPSGDFVFNLPVGQVSNVSWTLAPTGQHSKDDLLKALASGNIYVAIDTASNPGGEVRGTFILGSGAQDFVPPPAPPALPGGAPTAADAARLLTQATFGPKRSEISTIQSQGIEGWVNAQLALPWTAHRAATLSNYRTFGGGADGNMNLNNRQAAWWNVVVTAPDQLRQRVAFALSEIFVVSDVAFDQNHTEGLANYYDLLGNGAFGNFRALLESVTRSPIMALYLSSLRNAKADPVLGTSPDENYAREVMQLFTVGLNLLQPDGTLKLDPSGLPIPTYNQNTVTEMAKVFTGWSYASTKPTPNFRGEPPDFINSIQLFPAFHEDGAKSIVNGVVLSPGQGGARDLQQAMDALFQHPNTGPFISKQLIQRLVTSNPNPAYVYRVARKFDDNGSGVRGDLGAVVRAILTDYEARSVTTVTSTSFGKLKEPILRATALLRTFGATADSGRYIDNLLGTHLTLAQASLRAPTVFNFFQPDYVLPGALAAAGLVAPEFQITDATYSISVPNFLRRYIFNVRGNNPDVLVLDLSFEQTLANDPGALLNHLALVMSGGNLPQPVRDRVTTMLSSLPASASALERVQRTLLVISTSPAGAVQK
jgi:uncharacterized protein (DUF1800 family)